MTALAIYSETDPTRILFESSELGEIGAALRPLGIRFERWQATVPLAPDATPDDVLAAYKADVDRLMKECGYQSADVVRMQPDHPDREAMRAKFLQEHTHADDEVRFFVEGSGAFYIRKAGMVHMIVCEAGDLLSVPAGTTHWFDSSAAPLFTAIRIFVSPEGWVAEYTGDDIASRYPRYERAAAATA